MALPDHWYSLGMPELMKEAARAFYGEIPDRENLGELPDGANFWTIEDPLDYMWSADKALRLLTDLPNSRVDLQDMLAGPASSTTTTTAEGSSGTARPGPSPTARLWRW